MRAFAPALLAAALPAAAAEGYTYVRMSLGVPWFLYFVFLAGVIVPFVLMTLLAGRRALRWLLPLGLAIVLAIVAVFVLNAFEVMRLMETEHRAGPTLLGR